jgi:alpha-galactosidase
MGWSSWNHFEDKISDKIIRAQADAMVSSGMRDAGYVYINIDDGWQGTRDKDGKLRGNERFPDMKGLADYIHSKGLKFGLYSSPGKLTCAKYTGSYGHEEQDARTFAEWGVDYLKYDLCGYDVEVVGKLPTQELRATAEHAAYLKMSRALRKTGRPIFYSICQYGRNYVWRWGASAGGNSWRTTGDITDSYDAVAKIGFGQAGLARFAAPGRWNDPDMLEVGNGQMTRDENRTHMSLWAILAAPLIAGNDLTRVTPDTTTILTHPEVIAINQDPAGRQGDRVYVEGPYEVWAKPLADGSKAVGVFNRQDTWTKEAVLHVDLATVGFPQGGRARSVWDQKELGLVTQLNVIVPAHGVALFIVRK